jgi:glycosyltransferase involved in cell wall biosynthesis
MLIGVDANEANVTKRVGSNQFAFQVLWQLHQQDKHNSYLIYLQNQPLKDLPPVNKHWQYQVLKPSFFWTQWRLPFSLYFDKPRPDIFLTLGHYAPRFSPLPTLISIMDLAFLKFPHTFLKRDLLKLKAWTKSSAKKATHIFTISKHTKKDIQKYYQLPESKITVTYPAIDHQTLTPKASSPIKADYLLYLGTLQPRKNLINLVKAFSLLTPSYPKLKLVIAGKKGWLYQSLFNQVNQLKLTKKVIFTDYIPTTKVPSLIKHAQALILPSFYEGFGIPVVQAMAIGTPVVVSHNSSLIEIVGSAGKYIKAPFGPKQIKQGIIEVLSLTQEQKKQLIIKAKQTARQFTWQKTGQTILEVLNDITL